MTEIKYVTIWYCWACDQRGIKTLHDGKSQFVDQVSDCPECGAPHYHQHPHFIEEDYEQTGDTPVNHPDAIEMYKQAIRRGIKKIFKNVPVEVLGFGFEQFLAMALISLIDNEGEFDKYNKLFTAFEDKLASYKDTIKLFNKYYPKPDSDNNQDNSTLEKDVPLKDDLIY